MQNRPNYEERKKLDTSPHPDLEWLFGCPIKCNSNLNTSLRSLLLRNSPKGTVHNVPWGVQLESSVHNARSKQSTHTTQLVKQNANIRVQHCAKMMDTSEFIISNSVCTTCRIIFAQCDEQIHVQSSNGLLNVTGSSQRHL